MTTTSTAPSKKTKMFFSDMFTLPPLGSKAVSTYMQVIKITTDTKSLRISEKIISNLNEGIKNLPKEENDLSIENLIAKLVVNKANLLELNKFFDTIDSLFDIPNTTIDDPAMMQFYLNMQKIKDKLLYMIEYSTLVIDIQENKKSESVYTLSQFLDIVGVAETIAA